MTMVPLLVGDERLRMARVAGMAAPVLAATLLLTMPLVGYSGREVAGWAALVAPGVLLAGVCAWLLPWSRWGDRALLVVPASAWACLAVLGVGSDGRAAVYGGYTALLFLFVGLTQRPWTSLPLLVPAVAVHLALYDGWQAELLARLPISVTVWVATAEVVARYRTLTTATVAGLEVRAHVDPLTGTGNRYDLPRRLAALRPGDAVVLLDLDHFKALNDTAGHAAGDLVLRDVGALLVGIARNQDTVVRYGGEEFLLLLPGAGAEGAVSLDARLRDTWARQRPDVTFSTGIAVVAAPAQGDGPLGQPEEAGAAALAHADEALYRAKSSGRARAVTWSAGTTGPQDRAERSAAVVAAGS